jgi:hypothetical protein
LCLYLVGPPEDELWLRLRLSSVPGLTRPSFAVAYAPRLAIIGQVFGLGGGARQHRPQHQEGVVIATKWSPWAWLYNRNRFASSLRLGMGGPRAYSIFHPNYGFVPVAATPVLDRHGGDSGEANGRNFRRRRSSLPSVSSFTAGLFFISQYTTQTVSSFNQ